jgi:hypothetical protein
MLGLRLNYRAVYPLANIVGIYQVHNHSKYRFVVNTLHPVFHTTGGSRKIELKVNEDNGATEPVYNFSLTHYMNKPPARGVAIEGQPKLQAGISSIVCIFPTDDLM